MLKSISNRLETNIYTSWFQFLVRYRKTMLGPLWLLIGPALFILFLGKLYSSIGGVPREIFVPHLTMGLVVWTLLSGFVIGSTTVFQRARSQVLQGGMSFGDIVVVDVFSIILQFLHQVILIVVVFAIFKISVSWYALLGFVGFALFVINGIWLTIVFGIVGARYRDLFEIMQAIMRIAFLATPIIWIPAGPGRGSILDAYLLYNPFYHFIQLIRAPLLGNPIAPLSWAVTITITVVGFILAYFFYRRFAKNIPLWV